jgi:CRP-like cAMP-binding protein
MAVLKFSRSLNCPKFTPAQDRCGSASMQRRSTQPTSVLFRQGTVPESLYVLFDGRVSLTGTAADESSAAIDILDPHSSFVLANALTGEPYSWRRTSQRIGRHGCRHSEHDMMAIRQTERRADAVGGVPCRVQTCGQR